MPLKFKGRGKNKKFLYQCTKCGAKDCQLSKNRREYVANARREARKRNKRFLIEFLLKHPCVDCGEIDPMVLDFDHISGKQLNVNTAARQGWSLGSLGKEIAKCEVRCVRCHRIKTAKQFGWYDTYQELVKEINQSW